MNAALWTLIWLNFRAVLRRMGRQLRSVRGAAFFIIGLCIIGFWVGSQFLPIYKSGPIDPRVTLSFAPLIIFGMCMLNLFTSAGERAVTFTPAEVDFLFPGPFSRRTLLIYKLTKTSLATIFSALLFGGMLRRFGGMYVYRVGGVWFLFQFMQLLAMTLALVQANLGERIFTAGRWWLLAIIAAAGGLAVWQVFQRQHELTLPVVLQATQTRIGRTLLAPFSVFAHLLAAKTLLNFLKWAMVAAVIDSALVVVVLLLDTNYMETSAAVSARRYARLARVRRSGIAGLAKPTGTRWKIPTLPWLAGTGPLIWRQSTTAIRTARTLLTILSLLAIGCGIAVARIPEERAAIGFLVGSIVYLNLFLAQMLKFDFRGDLDYLEVLRSLPIRPVAVAAAQLVVPSLVLAVLEILLLVTIFITGFFNWKILLAAGAFGVQLTLLTVSVDNLLFMLFPYRPVTAVAGDMGLIGRQAIVFACRALLLVLVIAAAVGFGAGVLYLTDNSWQAACIAAIFPPIAAIGLVVWLIGAAFERYDPSAHTPA